MHLEQQRDVVGDARVVVASRAIRGADLDEPGARLAHHLGHAEAAADLDELAPRHRDALTASESREREQHRAAPLFTTSAASAPHARASSAPARSRRDPRRPVATSSSRFVYAAGCSTPSGARPRLVCSSTPVALITGPQQRSAGRLGDRTRAFRVAAGDRGPGGVDEQRVWQADVGDRPGQRVDGGRAHERPT